MIFKTIRTGAVIAIYGLLTACGGGGGSSPAELGGGHDEEESTQVLPVTPTAEPIDERRAARFLNQATFGATASAIDKLASIGYEQWFDSQFKQPQVLHRTYLEDRAALEKLRPYHFHESFYQQTVNGQDQLRQRIAFALSQIFVVSFQDSSIYDFPRGVASYYDMLAANAFGNYRTLLEQVALHPMMGIYLTHIRNQKESANRTPDENFAREIMQLMSIGLYELNQNGTLKLANGKPIETYTNADIAGLAKVFTGWSWGGPDRSDGRFWGSIAAPDREWLPMQAYAKFHSTSQKTFLGTSVNGTAEEDLKVALDRLFMHPNVGPFIGKQLIQRLVTSNPSPAYVSRVAAVFNNNGKGVRGDMKAVIKAILLDHEARNIPSATNIGAGKLREPVLRVTHWMRAFDATSASGRFLMDGMYHFYVGDPLHGVGQSPMWSPSVFNFYRPGYVPPNTSIAAAGLVAPEMQITTNVSTTGYLNFMRNAIPKGIGTLVADVRDIKPDYSDEIALAHSPEQLVDRVNLLLLDGRMSAKLRSKLLTAVNSIVIPATDDASILTAKKNRVYLAVYLAMAAPEYIVQK